jgi:hypothetical protein
MVRRTATLVLALALGGCFGPQKLTRHMDDWTNRSYVESPWLLGNAVSAAALRGIFAVTNAVDAVFINPWYFWWHDAEPLGRGRGTWFEHTPAVPERK